MESYHYAANHSPNAAVEVSHSESRAVTATARILSIAINIIIATRIIDITIIVPSSASPASALSSSLSPAPRSSSSSSPQNTVEFQSVSVELWNTDSEWHAQRPLGAEFESAVAVPAILAGLGCRLRSKMSSRCNLRHNQWPAGRCI